MFCKLISVIEALIIFFIIALAISGIIIGAMWLMKFISERFYK